MKIIKTTWPRVNVNCISVNNCCKIVRVTRFAKRSICRSDDDNTNIQVAGSLCYVHCTQSAICIIITYNLSSDRIILSVKKVFS